MQPGPPDTGSERGAPPGSSVTSNDLTSDCARGPATHRSGSPCSQVARRFAAARAAAARAAAAQTGAPPGRWCSICTRCHCTGWRAACAAQQSAACTRGQRVALAGASHGSGSSRSKSGCVRMLVSLPRRRPGRAHQGSVGCRSTPLTRSERWENRLCDARPRSAGPAATGAPALALGQVLKRAILPPSTRNAGYGRATFTHLQQAGVTRPGAMPGISAHLDVQTERLHPQHQPYSVAPSYPARVAQHTKRKRGGCRAAQSHARPANAQGGAGFIGAGTRQGDQGSAAGRTMPPCSDQRAAAAARARLLSLDKLTVRPASHEWAASSGAQTLPDPRQLAALS